MRFHAYKSVAPLKRQIDFSALVDSAQSFHAYKSVAPLKRQPDVAMNALPRRFHAYKSVAPLKPVHVVLLNL